MCVCVRVALVPVMYKTSVTSEVEIYDGGGGGVDGGDHEFLLKMEDGSDEDDVMNGRGAMMVVAEHGLNTSLARLDERTTQAGPTADHGCCWYDLRQWPSGDCLRVPQKVTVEQGCASIAKLHCVE